MNVSLRWKEDDDLFTIPVDKKREIVIYSMWYRQKEWFNEMGIYLVGYYLQKHPLKKWNWFQRFVFVYFYIQYLKDYTEKLENFLFNCYQQINEKTISDFKRIKL